MSKTIEKEPKSKVNTDTESIVQDEEKVKETNILETRKEKRSIINNCISFFCCDDVSPAVGPRTETSVAIVVWKSDKKSEKINRNSWRRKAIRSEPTDHYVDNIGSSVYSYNHRIEGKGCEGTENYGFCDGVSYNNHGGSDLSYNDNGCYSGGDSGGDVGGAN